jgi:amino acid adenylation domain-containing protein
VNLTELLQSANRQGIELWFEGDKLRFRAPQGALSPELRTALKEQKEALLVHLRQQEAEQVSQYPVSYGQQGIWITNETYPDSPALNVAFSSRIWSEVDVPRLHNAFQSLVDRHAVLRTVYAVNKDGLPEQRVYGYMPVDFRVIDASDWDESTLHEHVVAEHQQPFDLASGPIMRVRLFSCAPQNHVLLLSIHHIAGDGWSVWLLLDELRQIYAGTALPRPETSYADYVRWERDLVEGLEGDRLWSYWQDKLKGELPVLRLPERDQQGMPTMRGHSLAFTLSEELSQGIKSLAQSEGITLYTMLVSAFLTVLYRYTGQTDILIASPGANRTRPEFAGIVGDFVNMFVLRADLSGSPTFRTLLGHMREEVLASLANQNYPLALITQKLRVRRRSSENAFFQVRFALQKPQQSGDLALLFGTTGEQRRIDFAGLEMEYYDIPQQEGQHPLTLDMIEGDRRITGVFKYDNNRLDAATVEQINKHFEVLLETVVANPDTPIDQLKLISEMEYKALLDLSYVPADSRPDSCVHRLFEAQVERVPHNVAVRYGDMSLTYDDLNRRANQMARHLQTLGVGVESRVGIHLNKSLDLIAAVLAVFKSGAAYVPLDPSYPADRLAYMLSDSGATILITGTQQLDQLPVDNVQVVLVDDLDEQLAKYEDTNLSVGVNPENLAYIIYTSGSTGKPKGVMVEHRNLSNAYYAWETAYGLNHIQSHLQMASFSFDVFAGDFVRALCSGGRLILCDRDTLVMPDQLYALMHKEAVEAAEFVPAVLRVLVDYLEQQGHKLDFMKLLICGSDSWSVPEYRRFKTFCGEQTRLINSFGLSEATIDSSYYESQLSELAGEGIVPIGRPFPGTALYVLDAHRQPVPAGLVGELYVGGKGLARGYWNRPDLTAERFWDSPFVAGERVYRTGDLARWLPNGQLEYLGRADFQIKLRGHRIEPGEIENQIKNYPGISQAVVTVRENGQGTPRLVAYFMADTAIDVSDLRTCLKSLLPDYMVPASFMQVDAFPITPNGKIDRRGLPEPDQQQTTASTNTAPLETPMQQMVADTWSAVLGIETVSPYDNFFDLGGHSLMVVQVITRLQEKLGVRLNPFYFQVESLAQIAFRYEDAVALGNQSSPVALEAEGGNLVGRLFKRVGR